MRLLRIILIGEVNREVIIWSAMCLLIVIREFSFLFILICCQGERAHWRWLIILWGWRVICWLAGSGQNYFKLFLVFECFLTQMMIVLNGSSVESVDDKKRLNVWLVNWLRKLSGNISLRTFSRFQLLLKSYMKLVSKKFWHTFHPIDQLK